MQYSSRSRSTRWRAVTAQWLQIASITAAAGACGEGIPATPTFVEDVAPILHAHCAQCHRPSGVAPFPLLTWEDARSQAALIAAATREHRMPPWLPDESDVPFADERRLSARDIAVLGRWVEQGATRGSGAAPAPPTFSEGWQLGLPDLILELPEPYELLSGEGDVFRNFVLPVPLREGRYVRAVDLQPGNLQVVHHAVVAVDPTATSRQEDAADPEPGFDGMFSRRAARPPPGFFIGWTPGRIARPNPEGLSWLLEPGVDLVLQMHLRPHGHAAFDQPRGKQASAQPHGEAATIQPYGQAVTTQPHVQAATIQPRVGIYFADESPARTPVLLRLGSQTLDIPPGAAAYAVMDSLHVPIDVELLSLYPHAHYLGRTMDVRAVLPNGRELQLLRIDDWDFNWQDAYSFERPVSLPAGSVIRLHYVYDNSAANPRNPTRPPVRVVYGPNSTDEMAELWIQAVPRRETELAVLQQEITRKAVRDYVEGWEHLIRINPRDAIAHASLAAFHSTAGNTDVAIRHYRSALDAEPDLAAAHYNLAMLLEARADADGALHHYREALRVRPDHAGTHNNLGNLLLARGNGGDAAGHFRRAIELDPDQAEAHNNLGRLMWDQGSTTEAIAHYQRALAARPQAAAPRFNLALALASAGRSDEALEQFEEGVRLEPNAAEAYVALAWLFATHPDSSVRRPQHALELGTRAARLVGRPHPRVLDVLAAAEAAAGRFDRAAELAAAALRLATDSEDVELANTLRERLNLYRLGRPFHERSRDARSSPGR